MVPGKSRGVCFGHSGVTKWCLRCRKLVTLQKYLPFSWSLIHGMKISGSYVYFNIQNIVFVFQMLVQFFKKEFYFHQYIWLDNICQILNFSRFKESIISLLLTGTCRSPFTETTQSQATLANKSRAAGQPFRTFSRTRSTGIAAESRVWGKF